MSDKERDRIPAWEWALAAFGVFLSFGSIAFMLFTGVAGEKSPPHVVVTMTSVLSQGDRYLVRFEAENHGDKTAANVRIRGNLKSGDVAVETSETTIDYLPSHSNRDGGLFFASDPGRFRLELVAEGYEEP